MAHCTQRTSNDDTVPLSVSRILQGFRAVPRPLCVSFVRPTGYLRNSNMNTRYAGQRYRNFPFVSAVSQAVPSLFKQRNDTLLTL
jgi:hypothetical protein